MKDITITAENGMKYYHAFQEDYDGLLRDALTDFTQRLISMRIMKVNDVKEFVVEYDGYKQYVNFGIKKK